MEQQATFAAGDFHAAEAAFRKVHGILRTRVGYVGEAQLQAVQLLFESDLVSYRELLKHFRQMCDGIAPAEICVFAHSPEQEAEAGALVLSGSDEPVQVLPVSGFRDADEDDQCYVAKQALARRLQREEPDHGN